MIPRLVWQERGDEFESTEAARSVLSRQLEDRVRFRIPPEPISRVEVQFGDEERIRRAERLALFWHGTVESREAGTLALQILRDSPLVDSAALELDIRPPDPSSTAALAGCESVVYEPDHPEDERTRNWSGCQRYLYPSPEGVDALAAWDYEGGTGKDVQLLDIEEGYDPQHEDLPPIKLMAASAPVEEHGTMVLGICCGHGIGHLGIRGVAYEASPWFFPVTIDWTSHGDPYPLTSVALETTLDREDFEAGSVVLLELHASYYDPDLPDDYQGAYLPVEVSPDVRKAIEDAAERKIYVVEAAGNNDVDLDVAGVTTPTSAIMVGAGTVPCQRRVSGTNYGSRVDCQGWGEKVVTTGAQVQDGPDWQDNLQRDLRYGGEKRCYTQSFNGTSSAASMVAGVVACLIGIVKANGLALPSPQYIKNLLRDTGTEQPPGASQHIGRLPNLSAAIARMESDYGVQLLKT